MTQCLLYVLFDMIFILRSFWWLHFNMCHMCYSYFYQLYLHSCFSSPPCVHRSSSFCLPLCFFSLLSHSTTYLPSFLLSLHISWSFSSLSSLPHVASCVHCMWAPISGPPILWARWSRLLWETLWHGEGMKVRPDIDCCPMSHSSLPQYMGYTNISSPVSV